MRWGTLVAAAVLGAFGSGCAAAGGSVAQQVVSWAGQSGIVDLDQTISYDVNGVEGSAAAGKLLTTRTVCSALSDDVSQAYVELPSPDPGLTNLLDQSDLELGQGANDCYHALAGTQDTPLLQRALGEIRRGAADLSAAISRLGTLGVPSGGS